MNIIKMTDVVKIYNKGKENETLALSGLNLEVKKGESVAVMGVSGSGKSTLLHIIGCLDNMTSGDYVLDGESVKELGAKELADLRNAKIGVVLQEYGLLGDESVYDNVRLPLLLGKKYAFKEIKARVVQILERVGIGELRRKKVRQLSGGQKQRVAIARAIVNDPELVLADEPTGALDSATAREIMETLLKLNAEGMTLIVVTHDPNVAAMLSRTVQIVDGKIEQ